MRRPLYQTEYIRSSVWITGGCDSIIVLDLRVMEPMAVISPPPLLACGQGRTWSWDGITIPKPGTGREYVFPGGHRMVSKEPRMRNMPFATKVGEYCLVLTHESNGVICTDTACVTVESLEELPCLLSSWTVVRSPAWR